MWLFLTSMRPASTAAFTRTVDVATQRSARQFYAKTTPTLAQITKLVPTNTQVASRGFASFTDRSLASSFKTTTRHYSSNRDEDNYSSEEDHSEFTIVEHDYKVGDKVLIEIVQFGPLGGTANVVASGHRPQDLPPEDEEWPVLAIGLISQRELGYFRDQRRGMDVVLGEVLPGWVERVRDSDRKVTIGLRAFGGKQKAQDVGQQILQLLKEDPSGVLDLGDKSSPADIAVAFPGVSKSNFKKAVSALFKQEVINKPQPYEIALSSKWMDKLKNKVE